MVIVAFSDDTEPPDALDPHTTGVWPVAQTSTWGSGCPRTGPDPRAAWPSARTFRSAGGL